MFYLSLHQLYTTCPLNRFHFTLKCHDHYKIVYNYFYKRMFGLIYNFSVVGWLNGGGNKKREFELREWWPSFLPSKTMLRLLERRTMCILGYDTPCTKTLFFSEISFWLIVPLFSSESKQRGQTSDLFKYPSLPSLFLNPYNQSVPD